MKLTSSTTIARATLALALTLAPAISYAYLGPGSGLSIVGSLLAFLAAIVIGIFGFIWFPVRRLLRKRKQAAQKNAQEKTDGAREAVNDPKGFDAEPDESDA